MPPLPLLPNQPAGAPDWYSPPTSAPASASADTAKWDQYLAQIQQALAASSGWERTKLEAQMQDAKKARDSAYKLAQLQASTSRYGVDQNTKVQMAQLEQNMRQFEASHGLEIKKFGLSQAEAYTKFASTPDMRWSAADFDNAVQRVGLGQGVAPISTNPNQPQAKTWADFAALSGFDQLPAVQAGQTGYQPAETSSRSVMPVGGGAGATTDMNGDGIPDPRIKATRAIVDALPPSGTPGNNDQDWAALNAIRNLYSAGKPGSLEALGPARRKIAQAGMARLGYDPNLVEEDYQRGLPGQQSVRRA